jgi:hypothetical protein
LRGRGRSKKYEYILVLKVPMQCPLFFQIEVMHMAFGRAAVY